MALQSEIDVSYLELEQKRQIAADLTEDLARKKAVYKSLRIAIKVLDARVESLTA